MTEPRDDLVLPDSDGWPPLPLSHWGIRLTHELGVYEYADDPAVLRDRPWVHMIQNSDLIEFYLAMRLDTGVRYRCWVKVDRKWATENEVEVVYRKVLAGFRDQLRWGVTPGNRGQPKLCPIAGSTSGGHPRRRSGYRR